MDGTFYVCMNKNWGWSSSGGRCDPEVYVLTEAVCVKPPGRDVPVSLYLTADKGQDQLPRELHLHRLCKVPRNILQKALNGRRERTSAYQQWRNDPKWLSA